MKKLIAPYVKPLAPVVFFSIAAVSVSHASTILEDYQQRSLIDFENLAIGAAPTVATPEWEAWTGNSEVTGQAPRQNADNPSRVALQGPVDRASGFSSAQANPFTASDQVVYFSAWINRTTSGGSGARIMVDDTNAGGGTTPKMAGFGVMDVAGSAFAFYDPSQGVAGTWIASDLSASHSKWWEVALVVEIDASDISKSLGSLYVRDITAGQTNFTLVTFEGGTKTSFEMHWMTNGRNVRDHFQYWRFTNFRIDAQIDNLAAGVIAIPEPSVALLGMGGMFLLPLLKSRIGRK